MNSDSQISDGSKNGKVTKLLTLIIDCLLVCFVTISLFMMIFGGTGDLSVQGLPAFKFYTVDSNTLMGLIALVCIPFDILVLRGKKEKSPRIIRILYHIGVCGTTLTFITVMLFLGIIYGYGNMFMGANLFMHLLTPLLAMSRFLLLGGDEEEMKLMPDTLYGTSTMVIYGIAYFINIGVHNGYGNTDYDWYMFGAGGPALAPLMFLLVFSLTYGIAFLLYFLQKKIHKAIYKE